MPPAPCASTHVTRSIFGSAKQLLVSVLHCTIRLIHSALCKIFQCNEKLNLVIVQKYVSYVPKINPKNTFLCCVVFWWLMI